MRVAFAAEIPGMTTEIYDRVLANMTWDSDDPSAGAVSHYACETPEGLFVFDVWEPADDWKRFAETARSIAGKPA